MTKLPKYSLLDLSWNFPFPPSFRSLHRDLSSFFGGELNGSGLPSLEATKPSKCNRSRVLLRLFRLLIFLASSLGDDRSGELI